MALTVAAGWSVVSRLRTWLSTLEAVAASTVVGIIGATWVALAGYLVTGQIETGIGLSALAMLGTIVLAKPWKDKWPIDRSHLPALAIIALVSFLFMFVCLLNYYDGEYHVAYPLYGDAAYHSALVTSFSQGVNYPPVYPFMDGQPLRYTFPIDFYSAMLDKLGLGLQWSIILPGMLLLASLLHLAILPGHPADRAKSRRHDQCGTHRAERRPRLRLRGEGLALGGRFAAVFPHEPQPELHD